MGSANPILSTARRQGGMACLLAAVLVAEWDGHAAAGDKITYDDHMVPILRNSCFKCHNPDKAKADLDLTTYSAVLKGGGSGKLVLPGDPDGSRLIKVITWAEEPYMPDNAPKMPDAEIDLVRKWIVGGLLEKSSSQALAANKPKIVPATGAGSKGRPEGPAVVPVGWRLDPARRTVRTNAVTALAASPWWPVLAVGGQDQLLLYQTATCELLGVLPFPEGSPSCLQFSRDGRLIVAGWGRGAKFGFADVYDVASGERLIRVGSEFDTVLAADLNADQTEVALGGPGKRVKVFSARDGRLLHDLKKHTDWVTAIQYSADSVLLATGDRNGGLVVWEAGSGQELYTLAGHQQAITSVSWRDDSEALLSASEDGTIRLWEMREGRQAANWTAHKEGVLDARFGHDGRIVSCGRDKQVAIWDGGGKKLRNWPAAEELPVRVTFAGDGSNVMTGSWEGSVTVWSAADGKPSGRMSANPLTLQERLDLAGKELERCQGALAKSVETVATNAAAAERINAAMKAHDRTSPTFEFLAAHSQAQAAHRRAAEEAGKGLEKLKAAAAKSAAELAAAEAGAGQLQAALEKVDKYSGPYQELARQLEAANQKLATATAKTEENGKALADRTAVAKAAETNLLAKLNAATQTRDQASGTLAQIEKQSAAGNQKLASAKGMAEQDKARLAEQQAALTQAMTSLTAAEGEAAKLAQSLKDADTNSPAGRELAVKMEGAIKLVADATAAHQRSQKAFGEAKTLADKSVAALTAAEADTVKLKSELEAAQKAFQAASDTLGQLETAKAAASETAKKETDLLQASVAQAKTALESAKAETVDLQAKIDKTEKFSAAFKEGTQRLEAANKQVAAFRIPAENDRKEAADLQGTLEKLNAAAAVADAEAAKAVATLARNDPGYQHYQEIEKEMGIANKKIEEAKAATAKARQNVDDASAGVTRVKQAQHQTALCLAREDVATRQEVSEKAATALAAAREDHEKAGKSLADARATLARQPAIIASTEARVLSASRQLNAAQAALQQVERDNRDTREGLKMLTLLIEKQNAVQAATGELAAAKDAEDSARKQFADLSRSIKPLTEAATGASAKLKAAEEAAANSSRELAAAKLRVENLAASSPVASAR